MKTLIIVLVIFTFLAAFGAKFRRFADPINKQIKYTFKKQTTKK